MLFCAPTRIQNPVAEPNRQDFILDGFPRRRTQATILEDMLSRHDVPLTLVVNLVVPDDAILKRIEGAIEDRNSVFIDLTHIFFVDRWVHLPSGRTYNLAYNPPKVNGKDDLTGESLSKREDDNPVSSHLPHIVLCVYLYRLMTEALAMSSENIHQASLQVS